jgi:5,10-methylenetetrahydromethanopterin reductase
VAGPRTSFGLGLHTGSTVVEIVKWARKAESFGYDLVSISEDPYYRDSLPVTSAVMSATKRIRVATGIINMYTKSPVYAAMAAATLDEIGDGRLILGLGRGVKSLIEGELHIRYGSPLEYTREYITCVKRLLAMERVTFKGKELELTNAQLHFKPIRSDIPILVAAMGPKSISVASRYADGLMLNSCTSTKHTRWARQVLDAHWRKRARPILTGSLWTSVDEDIDVAYDSVRTLVGFLLSIPNFGETFLRFSGLPSDFLPDLRRIFRWDEDVGDPMWHLGNPRRGSIKKIVPDNVVDALAVCGPVEECRKRFREYFDSGLTTVIVSPMTPKTFGCLRELVG